MKFLHFLNEWIVKYEYAGRDVAGPQKNLIIWMYLTNPSIGLLWVDSDGSVYLNKKKIDKISNASISLVTHKKIVAVVYNKLPELHLSDSWRNDVNTVVDSYGDVNPRGRIVDNRIYVYSSGTMGAEEKTYKKLCDKAIDAIYNYVPEQS